MLLRDRSAGIRRSASSCHTLVRVERDVDDIVADDDAVAVAKPMRLPHSLLGTIQKGAVGRDVVQPITAVAVMNLAMLARNETRRIRQRPVQMTIPTDIDRTLS